MLATFTSWQTGFVGGKKEASALYCFKLKHSSVRIGGGEVSLSNGVYLVMKIVLAEIDHFFSCAKTHTAMRVYFAE